MDAMEYVLGIEEFVQELVAEEFDELEVYERLMYTVMVIASSNGLSVEVRG